MHDSIEPLSITEADVKDGAPGCAQSIWLPAYQQTSAGEPQQDILNTICRQLAELLQLPLVILSRRRITGLVTMEGHSHQGALWIELQRMPERCDGTVAGNGPAPRTLQAGHAVWMEVSDEGFLPWRSAAEDEHIAAAGAWPLQVAGDTWLLQLFAADADWFVDASRQQRVDQLCREMSQFLADEASLREQHMLASALIQAGNPCFITDLDGNIVWSNPAFTRLTGRSAEDVRGKNPRILQSGRQRQRYYQGLWNTIRSGQVWSGETVDRDRLGADYTIRQTISPFAVGARPSHYLSIHEDISSEKAVQLHNDLEQPLDPQSGLLNRASFEQALREACLLAKPFMLAMVSMPRLQSLARAMGPEAQALVAAEVGERVRGVLGSPHKACRNSDAELLCLLTAESTHQNELLLAMLRPVLIEPYPLIGGEFASDYREVALNSPEAGSDPEALLHRLDRCMADEPFIRVPVRAD